ncbi:MAG TPA: hypothetical protein VJL81_14510 [Solirubrobacterales bacterium]|nr:hypothetical protein [Solirubrobacterales bacterium]
MFGFSLVIAGIPLIVLDQTGAPGWVLVGCFLLTVAVELGLAELDRKLDLWTPLAYARWLMKTFRRRRTDATSLG